jgi:hypothetical protein
MIIRKLVILICLLSLSVLPVGAYTINTNIDGFEELQIGNDSFNSILDPDYETSGKLGFILDEQAYKSFVKEKGDNRIESISYTLTYPSKSSESAKKGINQYATITFDRKDFSSNPNIIYNKESCYVAKPYPIVPDPTKIIQIDCDVKIKCWYHGLLGSYSDVHTHHITIIPDTSGSNKVINGTRMAIGFNNVYHAFKSDDTTIAFNDTVTVVKSGGTESTAYVNYKNH